MEQGNALEVSLEKGEVDERRVCCEVKEGGQVDEAHPLLHPIQHQRRTHHLQSVHTRQQSAVQVEPPLLSNHASSQSLFGIKSSLPAPSKSTAPEPNRGGCLKLQPEPQGGKRKKPSEIAKAESTKRPEQHKTPTYKRVVQCSGRFVVSSGAFRLRLQLKLQEPLFLARLRESSWGVWTFGTDELGSETRAAMAGRLGRIQGAERTAA